MNFSGSSMSARRNRASPTWSFGLDASSGTRRRVKGDDAATELLKEIRQGPVCERQAKAVRVGHEQQRLARAGCIHRQTIPHCNWLAGRSVRFQRHVRPHRGSVGKRAPPTDRSWAAMGANGIPRPALTPAAGSCRILQRRSHDAHTTPAPHSSLDAYAIRARAVRVAWRDE